MDRRERYDPEDIEILMQERSFEELLEEERAYVLRHVSDRAEYEAMRSLLMHMRDETRDHDPIEADPAIRANVLLAFRNEQQPQWRIWLNSVGSALFPEEAMAMWRPALALAGLALVVVVAVMLVRQADLGTDELAEIRPAKTVQPETRSDKEPQEDKLQQQLPAIERNESPEEMNTLLVEEQEDASTMAPVPATGVFDSDPTEVEDAPAYDALAEGRSAPRAKEQGDVRELSEVHVVEREVMMSDSEVPTRSHVVTAEELSRNMSVANATGKVRVKQREADDLFVVAAATSKSVADNAALLTLVAAGW